MKITTLIENTTDSDELQAQHGLSYYIEYEGIKILFDCGQDDSFIKNAKILDIDLSEVDYCIISHGHYDHGSGLKFFLDINNKAKVILSNNAFGGYYKKSSDGKYNYIGIDKSIVTDERFVFVDKKYELNDKIIFISGFDNSKNSNNLNELMYKKIGDEYIIDDFQHEISMIVRENNKNILISGCFHSGVVNIIKHIKATVDIDITHVVGGFHLEDRKSGIVSDNEVKTLSNYLTKKDIVCYTGHCSGENGFKKLKDNDVRIYYTHTGNGFQI